MEALNGYHAKQGFVTTLEINDGSKDGDNKAELQHRFPNAVGIQFFPGTVSQHHSLGCTLHNNGAETKSSVFLPFSKPRFFSPRLPLGACQR